MTKYLYSPKLHCNALPKKVKGLERTLSEIMYYGKMAMVLLFNKIYYVCKCQDINSKFLSIVFITSDAYIYVFLLIIYIYVILYTHTHNCI